MPAVLGTHSVLWNVQNLARGRFACHTRPNWCALLSASWCLSLHARRLLVKKMHVLFSRPCPCLPARRLVFCSCTHYVIRSVQTLARGRFGSHTVPNWCIHFSRSHRNSALCAHRLDICYEIDEDRWSIRCMYFVHHVVITSSRIKTRLLSSVLTVRS